MLFPYFSNMEFPHLCNHVFMLHLLVLFYNVSRRNKGERGPQRTQPYFTAQLHLRQKAAMSKPLLNATFGLFRLWDATDGFLEGCPFSQVIPPIEQGSLFLTFPLLAPPPPLPPKYTRTLVLGLHFPKHILRVSLTDCFATLQMAQHFCR